MKPRNFPARKLHRQMRAQRGWWPHEIPDDVWQAARDVRTKKDRRGRKTSNETS